MNDLYYKCECLDNPTIIIIIIKFICIAPESILLLSGASHNVQIVAKIRWLIIIKIVICIYGW